MKEEKKKEPEILFTMPESVKPQLMHTGGGGTYSETGRIHQFRTGIEEPPPPPPNVGLFISPEFQRYLDMEDERPSIL